MKGWKNIFHAVVTKREQEWLYLYQIKYTFSQNQLQETKRVTIQ